MTEQESLGRYHAALASGLSDYEAREDGWPTAAVTPREVLDDRFDSDHVAITALAALSAAGYEVLPAALVDAVLAAIIDAHIHQDRLTWAALIDARQTLDAHRRAPELQPWPTSL